jgi:hypothetical protein
MEVGWGFVVSVTTMKSVRFGFCGRLSSISRKREVIAGGDPGLSLPWPQDMVVSADVAASTESA